ncbi:MAG: YqaJ viral recombinase family protein, partial [Azovibrio sp.]
MNGYQEFLKSRQTGLGGSDIATLLGINPFSTRLELYLQKKGEISPLPDSSRTKAGRAMESVIASMVSERTGHKLRRVNRTLRHPKHDFLIAHIDRQFVGQAKGLEIKNVDPRMEYLWGRNGEPDAIAEYYVPQPHHYMLVLDYPVFDVAAFFGGDDLRIYPMERDLEMDEIIIEIAHRFWYEHVLAGIPPDPEFDHPTTLPLFKRLYPGTNGEKVQADESLIHWS